MWAAACEVYLASKSNLKKWRNALQKYECVIRLSKRLTSRNGWPQFQNQMRFNLFTWAAHESMKIISRNFRTLSGIGVFYLPGKKPQSAFAARVREYGNQVDSYAVIGHYLNHVRGTIIVKNCTKLLMEYLLFRVKYNAVKQGNYSMN